MGSVETLDGAGQPDEPLETLDVSTAVVHQLVFSHSSATAETQRREWDRCFSPHQHQVRPHHSVNSGETFWEENRSCGPVSMH